MEDECGTIITSFQSWVSIGAGIPGRWCERLCMLSGFCNKMLTSAGWITIFCRSWFGRRVDFIPARV